MLNPGLHLGPSLVESEVRQNSHDHLLELALLQLLHDLDDLRLNVAAPVLHDRLLDLLDISDKLHLVFARLTCLILQCDHRHAA